MIGPQPAADAAETPQMKQAAAWRVYLTGIGAETSPQFEAWLCDPENAAAWRQISAPWDYLSEQANEPELIAIRQAALGDARRANARHKTAVPRLQLIAALAAMLLIGGLGWGVFQWQQWPDDYRTQQGERRVITLVDGSKISLDASSEVTVRYTKNSRDLRLLKGQARFDVAHDVERPFSVHAGNQKVIATGTAFNIDMAGPEVLVTLIEGHVVVLDENIPASQTRVGRPSWAGQVELKAGQQLAAVPAIAPEVGAADVQRVLAWTNGQIMFDNESLASLVSRVNRYSVTQIVIVDPKLETMRISGVLNAGDVNGFVDIVTHYLPVRASASENGVIALTGETKSRPE